MNKLALQATLHCLLGCSVGEVAGMMLGAHYGWGTALTVVVAVALAFVSGYGLSLLPLVRSGMSAAKAMKLVLVADTLSIATMEIVDNVVMVLMPGAMNAGLTDGYFWLSMVLALGAAFAVAYPVNLFLLRRGQGHALTHEHMHQHHDHHQHQHHTGE